MKPISEQRDNSAMQQFFSRALAITGGDFVTACNLTHKALKYYSGSKLVRANLREYQDLEKRWYDSLAAKRPDYSVYDDEYILTELWTCWVLYSSKYLRAIRSPKSLDGRSIVEDMGNVRSAIDLGNGIGYTTATLKEIWPAAKVYGTNIATSRQWPVVTDMAHRYGFRMVQDVAGVGHEVDLVFASEYFEHIENPVKHLVSILATLRPKYLIVANAFGAISLGHFNEYIYQDNFYTPKETSRLFNSTLREFGYEKVKTKLWNQRPAYYKKIII